MSKQGHIYIGYDESNRYFKIGKSINPARREKEIANMNPTFKILTHVQVPDQDEFERMLHNRYSSRRVVGEWFDLSAKDISELTDGKLSADFINTITGRNASGNPSCPHCRDVMERHSDATTPQDVFYFCNRCDKAFVHDPLTGFLCEEGES